MSRTELNDNLVYFSAMQTLRRLVNRELLSDAEAKAAEGNLRRKLRPTV